MKRAGAPEEEDLGGQSSSLAPLMKKPSLLRQASGIGEEKNCFCSDAVGKGGAGDIRLGCKCLVHEGCLVTYIRFQLGDKASLF